MGVSGRVKVLFPWRGGLPASTTRRHLHGAPGRVKHSTSISAPRLSAASRSHPWAGRKDQVRPLALAALPHNYAVGIFDSIRVIAVFYPGSFHHWPGRTVIFTNMN